MKQKKIVLTVTNLEGVEIFRKDGAVPQEVTSAIILFDNAGNTIHADIQEFEVGVSNPS